MCGSSYTYIRDLNVDLYLGYYGGSIKIGEISFYDEHRRGDSRSVGELTREQFIKYMKKFKKEELINLIADIVENGEEP